MADHDLRQAIDALCTRLQSDLQTEVTTITGRYAEEREAVRRDADAQWTAKLDAVRQEWQGRLQAGMAQAAADAEQRLAAEAERARLQIEHLTKAAAETGDLHHKEIEALREEWQGRLQAGMADAAANAERRLVTESDRIRGEAEEAAAASTERVRTEVRKEMELAASASSAQLRAQIEQNALLSTARLREELEQAAAHATARLQEEMNQALAAERERAGSEIEGEHARVQALLAAERDRAAADVEAERLKGLALSATLQESRAEVAREREATRQLAASIQAARNERAAVEAQAVIDAHVAERQAQLAVVERLLGAVREIDGARSLSDTLTSLTQAAASVAPRAALFVVNGQDLRGWTAAGFADDSPAGLRFRPDDRAARGLLHLTVTTGRPVSTATEPAPAFAMLPQDRAGLAVPITVGGQSVAVLYADDASASVHDAPASWPEAIQVLAAHASACLSQITAVRTTQAMHHMATAGGSRPGASAGPLASVPGPGADSSARRYARLLVSEIKLYNEAAVRTGREKRDLLTRLAPEIERARTLYEERVPPAVGARAAYFQQELVHTLADGDSTLLGDAG